MEKGVRDWLYAVFVKGNNFKKEFRRQMRMLIVVTLGFTIAFSWRETVFNLSQELVKWITNIQNSALSSILTSTFITIVSLILIYFTAHFLKEDNLY